MKRISTILAIFSFFVSAYCQQVTTLFDSTFQIDDALMIDSRGNLYGSHYVGNSVFKITPSGDLSVFVSGLNTPNGLALDSEENIYIVDNQGNRIYKVDTAGNFLDTIAVNNPSGIIKSWDSDTMIFTQYAGNRIAKLAPDGTIVTIYQGSPLNGPVGLAYDSTGVLYTGDFDDRKIYRVFTDSVEYVATVPAPNTTTNRWLGFIAYAQGYLWGTSFGAHKIYKIHPAYVDSVILFAGGAGGNLDGHIDSALFNQPNGIIASVTGDTIYVSDFGSKNVRMITPEEDTVSTSVSTRLDMDLQIFPNPMQEVFIIKGELKTGKSIRIAVRDALGKTIFETQNAIPNEYFETQVETQSWPSGAYYLTISSEKSSVSKLLIKQH